MPSAFRAPCASCSPSGLRALCAPCMPSVSYAMCWHVRSGHHARHVHHAPHGKFNMYPRCPHVSHATYASRTSLVSCLSPESPVSCVSHVPRVCCVSCASHVSPIFDVRHARMDTMVSVIRASASTLTISPVLDHTQAHVHAHAWCEIQCRLHNPFLLCVEPSACQAMTQDCQSTHEPRHFWELCNQYCVQVTIRDVLRMCP